jgi:hypothetical protein
MAAATRQRLVVRVAVVVALLACAVGLVVGSLPPRPGVTQANFDRIAIGMSRADVEKLFGGPRPEKSTGYMTSSNRVGEGWHTAGGDTVIIVFDPWQHDRVMEKEWRPSQESLLDRLRRWLRF